MATNNAVNNNYSLILLRTDNVIGGGGVSELDYSNIVSTKYNGYKLLANDVTNSADTAVQLLVQISTDGGMTWITTDYVGASGATNGMEIGIFQQGSDPDDGINIQGYIQNLSSVGSGYITTQATNVGVTSGTLLNQQTFGAYTVIDTLANAFRLVTDDGSNFEGIFYLYGYRV